MIVCSRVIHSGKSSTVYEHSNYTVTKVCHSVDFRTASNELAVASMEWQGLVIKTFYANHCEITNTLYLQQSRGERVGKVFWNDVASLVLSYATMEARGLVHGDICPRNIVRSNGRLVPIDFGILSDRNERAMDLQSIKDVTGRAYCAGYVIESYNAINSAIYAFGVTVCMLMGYIPSNLVKFSVEEVENVEVRIDPVATYVSENVVSLCEKHYILRKTLPRERVQSFWLLIDIDTKWIYNKCAAEMMSCKEAATLYEAYYRYGTVDEDRLLLLTRGEHVTWVTDHNQTLRLLREYHCPGSWYVPCGKCETVDDLMKELTDASPEIVMYCFGGATMYYSKA